MFKIAHEVELRGPLHRSRYDGLLRFLRKNGKSLEHRTRTNYLFDHKNKQVDLRVRSTNDDIEMVLKLGHVGAHRRKEISFRLGKIKLEDALDFLYHLSYRKGWTGVRISDIFKYMGFEFAVVSVPGRGEYHTYYFEIEGKARAAADVPKVKKRMLRLLKRMDLRTFSKKEYDNYLIGMNKYASERFVLKG